MNETIPKILPRRHIGTGLVIQPEVPMRNVERNEQYLRYIRGLPCCHCAAAPQNEAAHVGGDGLGGTGIKTDDYRTVPLCHGCHFDELHRTGELPFWGTDTQRELELVIARCLCRYFNLDVMVSLPREE